MNPEKRINRRKFLIAGASGITIAMIGYLSKDYWIPNIDESYPTITSDIDITTIDLSESEIEKMNFKKYYSFTPSNITPKAPQYDLPLKKAEISNFQNFSNKISLNEAALTLLEKNGFVIIDNIFNQKEDDITRPYDILKDNEIPIFITSDSLLHLYHIQFDETLRQIEEKEFFDKLWNLSKRLLNSSIEDYDKATGDFKEALKRNIAYFAVGMRLLQPRENQLCEDGCEDPGLASAYFNKEDLKKYNFTVPNFVSSIITEELELIEGHKGFSESSIFLFKEDYSQYLPRGHYTRSEKLKNYFKGMMWYGRMAMLLKGSKNIPPGETDPFDPIGLISIYDAKIQTIQASIIALKFAQDKKLVENWDRIYSVTAFYVGLSDDLGPFEYLQSLNSVFNDKFDPNKFSENNIGKLKAKLAEYMPPKIFGGTGNCGIDPPFTPEQADQCLEKTKGFRLMGQRFIPDSYFFSNLVGAYTDVFLGDKEPKPFTFIISGAGRPIRGFPRGLDVMALLGSKRATQLLKELDDSNYKTYDEAFDKLEEEFSEFNESDWNQNLYWSWLHALKPLLKEFGSGYPTFMQTQAWQDKELTTALASWAELRHDTILYAKQSYTMAERALPLEKKVFGYVEPVPEFYNRLLSLTQMTNRGLKEMNVLDDEAKKRLERLEKILERLFEISKKELQNIELTEEDHDFINNIGKQLNNVIDEVDEKAKKTTIIADVHTDGNTSQVLEEGVGHVRLMIVAYRVPDNRILIGVGPVLNYKEFKHPMEDRLTDEKWREMLITNPPEDPEWNKNFTA